MKLLSFILSSILWTNFTIWFSRYENLILVAGGIGISPFLAILSDILHRTREGKPCLPRNILIVWAVKRSNELPLLSSNEMELICPFFSDKLSLEIHIFVTRESQPPLVCLIMLPHPCYFVFYLKVSCSCCNI